MVVETHGRGEFHTVCQTGSREQNEKWPWVIPTFYPAFRDLPPPALPHILSSHNLPKQHPHPNPRVIPIMSPGVTSHTLPTTPSDSCPFCCVTSLTSSNLLSHPQSKGNKNSKRRLTKWMSQGFRNCKQLRNGRFCSCVCWETS